MSTADEINARMAEAAPSMQMLQKNLADAHRLMLTDLQFRMLGRRVHARRAARLRRRGESVRFCGYTVTGKTIYLWVPRRQIGGKGWKLRPTSLYCGATTTGAKFSRPFQPGVWPC